MRLVTLTATFLAVWLGNASAQYPSGGGGGGFEPQLSEYGCPLYTHDCVPFYQCSPQGDIITDGEGLINPRIRQRECNHPDYPDSSTICCRIPGIDPLPTCPGFLVCVEDYQCRSDGSVNTDGGGIFDVRFGFRCQTGTGTQGVCCRPPPPRLETCPAGSYCSPLSDCTDEIYDNRDAFQPYQNHAIWAVCPLDGTGYTGICCRPLPTRLETCPVDSYCSSLDACTTEIYNSQNAFQPYQSQALWAECPIPGTSIIGVCCRPPIIDICPVGSSCLSKEFCQRDILDVSNAFQPHTTQTAWSKCPINLETGDYGVCCRDPPHATQCGVRNFGSDVGYRIQLQKNQAEFGEFPWQAIIFFTNFTFVCGASLVTDTHLVTAAHCVAGYSPYDFSVRLGEWQVNAHDELLPYVDVKINSITIHPNFIQKNLHNDVAVIELAHPVDFKYHINTVCLPRPGEYLDPGTRCFVSGWGKDAFTGNYQHILKKLDVPLLANPYCQNLLRKTRLGQYFQLHESFLCAGGEPGKDACTGDGGGPLVCQNRDGLYVLYGIVAWGIDCGIADVPGVYVDTLYFSEWITQALYGVPVDQVTQPHNPYGKK